MDQLDVDESINTNTFNNLNLDEPLDDDSSSDEESSNHVLPECQICETIPSELFPPEELYRLFHEDCSACPDEDWVLCDWCRHARLKHIFLCPNAGDDVVLDPILMPHIKTRIFEQTATDCAFCSFVEAMANEALKGSSLENCLIVGIASDILSLGIRSAPPYMRARQLRVYFHGEENGEDQNYWDVPVGLGVKSPSLSSTYSQGSVVEFWQPTTNHNPATETASMVVRNTLSRPSRATINWDAIRALLAVCCKEHPNCHSEGAMLPSGFRVIDVERRCIVEPKETIEYSALSYVWGEAAKIEQQKPGKLTKSLLGQFERRDSLSPSELPRTIEDAIQACLALRIQYLWVDRFCIIQDDEHNKARHIQAMGEIFASANLAFIATGANDMHSGISGISNPRKAAQWTLSSFSSDLVQTLPALEDAIVNSRWSPRAWTYQEAVLSRRKLWLTSAEVYFQCGEGEFTEDFFVDLNGFPSEHTQLLWSEGIPTSNLYFLLLAQYSERSLTYNSDVYNAFTGIANMIYKTDALVYGLPRADFDQALLWNVWGFEPHKARIAETVLLPSWSWASIDSQGVGIRSLPYQRAFCGSLVQWVVCTESEGQVSLEPIRADNTPKAWETERKGNASLYMALACIEDCFLSARSAELLLCRNGTFNELGLAADALWPTYKSFCRDLYSRQEGTPWLHSIKKQPGTLLGRTQTAMLRFSIQIDDPDFTFGFGICDDYGQQIGAVAMPEQLWSELKGSRIKVIALSVSALKFDYPALVYAGYFAPYCQDIRRGGDISKVQPATEKVLQDRNENLTFFDSEGKALLPPPLVELMVVEEEGNCYRRVGLGWAFLSRWVYVERTIESLALI